MKSIPISPLGGKVCCRCQTWKFYSEFSSAPGHMDKHQSRCRECCNVVRRHPVTHLSDETRFWTYVDKSSSSNGCWLWTGGRSKLGYGRFNNESWGTGQAHRISYILANGPIPDGLLCCHDCPGPLGDNPSCVNPAHLWLGTNADNLKDMAQKGRNKRGSQHWNARLTEDIVRQVRKDTAGRTINSKEIRAIASQRGVDVITIWEVIHDKSWRHVK